MVDEFEQDAIFLSLAIIENNTTELYKKYLEAFYEEEFDKDSAIESTQKRSMISRKKIIAFLSKDRGSPIDASTSRDVANTVSKTYSGYVHGASPHIMEMCYGVPPRFHTISCSDSPLFEDHREDLLNYLYRGICAFAISARAFGLPGTCRELMKYSIGFAESTGTKDQFINPKSIYQGAANNEGKRPSSVLDVSKRNNPF